MRTIWRSEGNHVAFVITEVEPEYQEAVRGLYYLPVESGFAKRYPTDTPGLERIYRQFERSAEEMVLQAARARPAPWDQALAAFLQLVEGQGLEWRLAGSAALAVRGIDVAPGDLDLVVANADVHRLAELLGDYLVEPLQWSRGWVSDWFGRAFLHARIEWVGEVTAEFAAGSGLDRIEVVTWRGTPIRVPALDAQRQECKERGLVERVEKIERYMREGRPRS